MCTLQEPKSMHHELAAIEREEGTWQVAAFSELSP